MPRHVALRPVGKARRVPCETVPAARSPAATLPPRADARASSFGSEGLMLVRVSALTSPSYNVSGARAWLTKR